MEEISKTNLRYGNLCDYQGTSTVSEEEGGRGSKHKIKGK